MIKKILLFYESMIDFICITILPPGKRLDTIPLGLRRNGVKAFFVYWRYFHTTW